jgi:hypothetical protein
VILYDQIIYIHVLPDGSDDIHYLIKSIWTCLSSSKLKPRCHYNCTYWYKRRQNAVCCSLLSSTSKMDRSGELSVCERVLVIGCHISKKSVRDIATLLKLHKLVVGDVILKWKCEGTTTMKPRPGKLHLMTDRDRWALKKVVREIRQTSSETITHEFCGAMNCPASTLTVHWELSGMGFHGQAAAHKPNILPVNAKLCLKWYKERCHWTVDNWKRVMWGDESPYTMWRSNKRVCVWRMPGKRYLPVCVVPAVKFGGGGIRVWRCFSWNGLGPLVILHGNLNIEIYKVILTRCVLSTIEDQFGDDDCLYQHDSAPCYKSRSVREWFVDSKVPEMECPAQRPDVNTVEHLWDELECRLCSNPNAPHH